MRSTLRVAIFSVFFSALLYSGATYADDTEIFFNTSEVSIRPNLMFVLDNSGSMDAIVETVTPYDPSSTYSGRYSDEYFYFRSGWSYYSIPWAANHCRDLTERLGATGYLSNYRIAVWRSAFFSSARWRSFSTASSSRTSSNLVECEADRGVHGSNDGGSSYARNNNNKWGNENQEINWSEIGREDIYSANYLNWLEDDSQVSRQTRLDIVKSVAKDLVDSLSDVKVGLMAFNTDGGSFPTQGGRVLVPVENVEGVRDDFKAAVDSLGYDTNTPLSETLFGAMRYFAGEEPYLDANPLDDTVSGGKYISPVQYECQSNTVIFLTDGEPTYDGDPVSGQYADQERRSREAMEAKVGTCTGNCMDEIADYMHNQDITSNDGMNINVSTYTVGFQLDNDLLRDAARKGGGEFFLVNDAKSLQTAFSDVVRAVLAVSTTYVAPGVAVNTFNRLNHLDSLYFSVFQPELSQNWDGNLKRYRLGSDGVIYDADGEPATDPTTGFFRRGSRSWWSASEDGPVVSSGGAASLLPDVNASRAVYTFIEGVGNKDLTQAVNALDASNTNLTKDMLGRSEMTDDERAAVLSWVRGADAFDADNDGNRSESRDYMADPLHSVPHLIIYGGTSEEPDTAVFFGDNQGFIHAINGNSGESYFSFMPEELLANQFDLVADNTVEVGKIYGMDGSIISWQKDLNNDGQISAADGDSVYIYGGMRRGGRSYYALDVTNRSSPRMLWRIQGGVGDFEELGQTWSVPVKTKLLIGKNQTDVLIFGGGYDSQQDSATVRTPDSVGRALYIVNANTGERLWWASTSGSGANLELEDMQYSIPSSVRVIDVTGDGNADQIYVGDMGGQVWRFDIADGETGDDLVTGGVIADLAGDTTTSARRFYHAPDVFGEKTAGSRSLGLIIGSGWQAHPLDNVVEDRIYKLRIYDVIDPPARPPVDINSEGVIDYTLAKVTEADLFDTTENLIGEGDDSQRADAQSSLAEADGWYIRLTRQGEKVLSTSQTINGEVFITTFEPVPNSDPCIPSSGTSRLYHVYVADGQPVVNYDRIGEDSALTRSDREVVLKTLGLPPDPQRMRVDGKDVVCVGSECFPVESLTGVVETYWYEE